MNFLSPQEYYDFLESANSDELFDLAKLHEPCFSNTVCQLESDWFDSGDLEDLIVCQIASAANVNEEILEFLLGMSTGNDGGRYEQIRWAILESPALTINLLRKIDPYGVAMARYITKHPKSDSKIIQEIYANWYDQQSILDFMKSDGFSESEINDYVDLIQRKMP